MLADALCRRFGLWDRLSRVEGLDPRRRKGAGFDPEPWCAQVILTLTSGGACLADAERLGADKILLESAGLEKTADQTTLAEWLRAQAEESIQGLCAVRWSMAFKTWQPPS